VQSLSWAQFTTFASQCFSFEGWHVQLSSGAGLDPLPALALLSLPSPLLGALPLHEHSSLDSQVKPAPPQSLAAVHGSR